MHLESGINSFKKVRLYFPHTNWPLLRQTPNHSGIWGNYKFYIEDTEPTYDYWVILSDYLLEEISCTCPAENIFFFTWEPPDIQYFGANFLKQFPYVVTCHKNINQKGTIHGQCGVPWFVGKNYDELTTQEQPPKTKDISIILSNKIMTKVHEKRVEFSLKLKDYFKEKVDIFGRGINGFDDKWDVLAPYKYSVAIENTNLDFYNTEKIYDCYLSYTYPFYYGSPNLSEVIPPKSFERINVCKVDESLRIIESILNDDSHYKNHLPFVEEARLLYLFKYQFFPLITGYLDVYGVESKNAKPVTIRKSRIIEKVYTKLRYAYDFKVPLYFRKYLG